MRRFLSLFFMLTILFSQHVTVTSARIIDVRKYGAVGDGKHIDSQAIDRAIEKASKRHGDTVFIGKGRYLCYSIHLKNNVTIKLDRDAVILAAAPDGKNGYDAPEYNPDSVYQDFGHSHWHNSLIWGEGVKNVIHRHVPKGDGTPWRLLREQRRRLGLHHRGA